MTPRFKYLIFLKSLPWVTFFIKFNLFSINLKKFYNLTNNNIINFYKYFFYFKLFKFFHIIDLSLVGGYTSNLKKSIVFYNFKILNNFLISQKTNYFLFCLHNKIIFNSYYLSIKLIDHALNKKYYKNIFYFFLFFLSNIWINVNSLFSFNSNFFFVFYFFSIYRFYNGFFFKVYNF